MKCYVCQIETTHKCALCKNIFYCSRECQKKDYRRHKQDCRNITITCEESSKVDPTPCSCCETEPGIYTPTQIQRLLEICEKEVGDYTGEFPQIKGLDDVIIFGKLILKYKLVKISIDGGCGPVEMLRPAKRFEVRRSFMRFVDHNHMCAFNVEKKCILSFTEKPTECIIKSNVEHGDYDIEDYYMIDKKLLCYKLWQNKLGRKLIERYNSSSFFHDSKYEKLLEDISNDLTKEEKLEKYYNLLSKGNHDIVEFFTSSKKLFEMLKYMKSKNEKDHHNIICDNHNKIFEKLNKYGKEYLQENKEIIFEHPEDFKKFGEYVLLRYNSDDYIGRRKRTALFILKYIADFEEMLRISYQNKAKVILIDKDKNIVKEYNASEISDKLNL